jgi:ParB family transcriptional regulator, chromosome partitioning protein
VEPPPPPLEPEAGPEAPTEEGPEEVTPEALAGDLATRLWEVNQDLSLAVDAWDELPDEGRRMILEQARYVAELYQFLAGGRRR